MLALLLLVSPASAWEALRLWTPETLPTELASSCPGLGELGAEEVAEWWEEGWATWKAAADQSCGVLPEVSVVVDLEEASTVPIGDGQSIISCDADSIAPPVVVYVLFPANSLAETMVVGGEELEIATEADYVLNPDGNWGTPEDCDDQPLLETKGVHELGHFLGLYHPCTSEEPDCSPAEAASMMYWEVEKCLEHPLELQDDDILGIGMLYGVAATAVDLTVDGVPVDREVDGDSFRGEVPFEVCGRRTLSAYAEGATWTAPDGSTSTEETFCFEQREPGDHLLLLQAHGPGCDEGYTLELPIHAEGELPPDTGEPPDSGEPEQDDTGGTGDGSSDAGSDSGAGTGDAGEGANGSGPGESGGASGGCGRAVFLGLLGMGASADVAARPHPDGVEWRGVFGAGRTRAASQVDASLDMC